MITTVAGQRLVGSYSGRWRPGHRHARSSTPSASRSIPSGNLFIADSVNNVVREVSARQRRDHDRRGQRHARLQRRRRPATDAELDNPAGVAVDAAGDIFIADTGNNRIREVNHAPA